MKKLIILSLVVLITQAGYSQTSLSLQECREMALQNSVKMKNARLDVLAASARKEEALAEYFPKVSVNSFGFMAVDPLLEVGVKDILGESTFSSNLQQIVDYFGEQFGFPSTYTALQYGYTASVSALQPLYAGGRIVNGNRLAALGQEASLLKNDIAVRDVMSGIDSDYWKVVALEEKMGVLEASELFLGNLYEDVSEAVSAGLALDSDLMQVELRRNELRKLRLSLTGGLRLAKMNLFNSIGQPYSLVADVSDSLKPFIDAVMLSDRLTDLRPPNEYYAPAEEIVSGLSETRLLDMSVEGKKLERKMAMGEALPQIGIGASYGYTQAINSRFNGIVFASVKIPLSDWGKTSRRMQRLGYEISKAQNDREYLKGQLLLKVDKLWLDVTLAWEGVLLAGDDMELASVTAGRVQDQYEAGLATLSDLLQARMQLRTRTDAYLEARSGYASALAAYLLER